MNRLRDAAWFCVVLAAWLVAVVGGWEADYREFFGGLIASFGALYLWERTDP